MTRCDADACLTPVAARVNRSHKMKGNSDRLSQMSRVCPRGACVYVCNVFVRACASGEMSNDRAAG